MASILVLTRRSCGIEKGLCVEGVESSIILCFPGFHFRLKRLGAVVRPGLIPPQQVRLLETV